eukprot:CAMPEP_0184694232 /NCGR_PEP_ID=MMETSP0313-20130426/2261_1 /TAXON_ID=2792 /ORGANISM="Porphyridium aerugineum, Strain SAG 1380-2" /LENGTH=180 /DNA_ID=CAMNT_0027152493 /DNA_START=29 /DNA_END=571 /DNA_ORIENTATION=+
MEAFVGLALKTSIVRSTAQVGVCRLNQVRNPLAITRFNTTRAASLKSLNMVVVYDAEGRVVHSIMDDIAEAGGTKQENPLKEIAPTICQYMNKEHCLDLIQYVCKYSDTLSDDLSEVEKVELYDINQEGMSIEVVLCRQDNCVCIHPEIPWYGNKVCTTADDVIESLSLMSRSCGLNGDI